MLPAPIDQPRVTRGAWRVGRAGVASVASVLTAVLGHRVGGGEVPAPVVAALLLAAGAVAWLLAGRRIAARQVVGLLIICQVVVHLAFSGHEMVMGPAMVLSHVAATAVCAIAVSRAERWAWSIAERLVLRPLAILRTFVVESTSRLIGHVADLRPGIDAVHHLVRGPPVGA